MLYSLLEGLCIAGGQLLIGLLGRDKAAFSGIPQVMEPDPSCSALPDPTSIALLTLNSLMVSRHASFVQLVIALTMLGCGMSACLPSVSALLSRYAGPDEQGMPWPSTHDSVSRVSSSSLDVPIPFSVGPKARVRLRVRIVLRIRDFSCCASILSSPWAACQEPRLVFRKLCKLWRGSSAQSFGDIFLMWILGRV